MWQKYVYEISGFFRQAVGRRNTLSRHRYYKITWGETSSEPSEYTDGISGSCFIV